MRIFTFEIYWKINENIKERTWFTVDMILN